MRPHQWYKNLVVFAGLIFGGVLFQLPAFVKSCAAVGIFCLLSGAGYLLNDVTDYSEDRLHPQKRTRPFASGLLSKRQSLGSAFFIFMGGLLSASLITLEFTLCAVAYTVLTVLYSLYLKHHIFIDVLTISILFVIRAAAGAYAISVYLSPWLILCAFMLALFLALCKRTQSEVYPSLLLTHLLTITTSLLIMSYCLYTFLRANQTMMITIPVVIYGIFSVLRVFSSEKTQYRKAESIFFSRSLIITVLVWIIMIILIMYVWE